MPKHHRGQLILRCFTITNMTSTLITITIPHIETQTILYDDDKLPDLTQMGNRNKRGQAIHM